MVTVQCPVSGCDYRNSPASVAAHVSGKKDAAHDWGKLEYSGAWDFRSSVAVGGEDTTTILHITDSHIGKQRGGFHGRGWPVDCLAGFQRAIDLAINMKVDGVVHTGDLFHNDKHGITTEQSSGVESGLGRLNRAGIQFYYILGDHERELGRNIMQVFVDEGWAQNLGRIPVEIGSHVALYGQNHRPQKFWRSTNWTLDHPLDRVSILALHQSLAPVTGSNDPEINVNDIARWTSERSDFDLDVILLGQLHRELDETHAGVRVICGGATERLGKTRSSIEGSAGLLRVGASKLSLERVYL